VSISYGAGRMGIAVRRLGELGAKAIFRGYCSNTGRKNPLNVGGPRNHEFPPARGHSAFGRCVCVLGPDRGGKNSQAIGGRKVPFKSVQRRAIA